MKKVLSLVLALAFVVGIAVAAEGTKVEKKPTTSTAPTTATAPAAK